MNRVYILRSLPGGGKSFLANNLRQQYGGIILSTDSYFLRPDNTYDFNPKLIEVAHAWNQQRFREEIDKRTNVIIVDNTNIEFWEVKVYVEYAIKHGYIIEVLEPDTEWKYDIEECFKRNSHGVPLETIGKMRSRWQSTEFINKKIEEIKNG